MYYILFLVDVSGVFVFFLSSSASLLRLFNTRHFHHYSPNFLCLDLLLATFPYIVSLVSALYC